jgi:hypothetical protein
MAAASLRALLERSIDYAGLFPPCSLELEPALQNHAEYMRAPENWMLGAFVLPVAQFEAAGASLSQFDHKHPLRVSALGPKIENAAEFRAALTTAVETIREFSARHGDVLSIHQLEMLLPTDVNAALLAEARSILGELKLAAFWETPPDTAETTINLLAKHHSNSGDRAFGYKLRTGGVAADAFPETGEIARALVVAATHRVPIKFTAGLHHPLRQFHLSVNTKMPGFLNVLGAGVLAAEHSWDDSETARMLEDENAGSFSFDDTTFAWREWNITTDRIRARRKLVTSFGSCSFDEPREDLGALKLL